MGEDANFDRLAQRAVDSVLHLIRRGIALAGGVLILAAVCCVGGFLLGLAALTGGARAVWVVLGGFFAFVGIGTVVTAMWRLRSVGRAAGSLVAEVRALISGDRRTERVVIETVESSEAAREDGVIVLSRQFSGFRDSIGDRRGEFREIAAALRAATTFPALVALSTLVSLVFAGLSLLFVIALLI